ncbi:glycosyltransferase [Nesterenkonia flava]|uniref:D-inositol 3-phosphate glycosyltransferase n=1 Tax=Nesterenkonia flava TaxID=469799 RepID=A0ABU1FTJ1_9MICC|nr:glycosyltransferase [Nesterenkonia flava]MDR5711985.1 glycosyltransferase [Nesterenkonia flava]
MHTLTSSGRSVKPSASPQVSGGGRRILIGADTFPPDVNGAARFSRDHAVRLARKGHSVHIVAPATGRRASAGYEQFDDVWLFVHRLPSLRWPLHDWLRFAPPWEARTRVRSILKTVKPDVVHIQSFLGIGRALAIESHSREIPTIATNHVMPENVLEYSGLPQPIHPVLTRYGWSLARSTYARVGAVTSPTPIAARYLQQHTGLGRVEPISCGIDTGRFTPKRCRPETSSVLYVGRLDREKNLHTLVEAFALVRQSQRATLDIVGKGSEREGLEQRARSLGIASDVRFHGLVSDDQLVRLHHQASVFVMPSPAELQSLATLEALSSATPAVVADAMALPHLVTDGVEGFRAAVDDPASFSTGITRILQASAAEYERYMQAALRRAAQHDSHHVLTQYEHLYDRTASLV